MGDATVYSVDPLLMEYQSLLIDLPENETAELFALGHEHWPVPPVCIDPTPRIVGESNEALAIPDIWYLGTFSNLVFTENVAARLEPYLSLAGDLLPLRDVHSLGREFFMLSVSNQKQPDRCLDISVGYERRRAMLERLLAQAGDRISAEEAEAVRNEAVAANPWPYAAPAFIADELSDALTFFRIAGLHRMFLLDHEDSDDSLLRRIAELRLTGISFEPVWSSTSGHRDINLYGD